MTSFTSSAPSTASLITKPVLFKDEVLLYALGRYFDISRGDARNTSKFCAVAILLALYRFKAPVRRDPLMAAAGIAHNSQITFRGYIHDLRTALGPESIILEDFTYRLSPEMRVEMDKAFVNIRAALEEAISPTRPAILKMYEATAA